MRASYLIISSSIANPTLILTPFISLHPINDRNYPHSCVNDWGTEKPIEICRQLARIIKKEGNLVAKLFSLQESKRHKRQGH